MVGSSSNTDLLGHELRMVVERSSSPDDLGEAVSAAVRSRVAYDALRLVGTNPAAGLGLASFSCWHHYEPELLSALVLDRFLGGDPCRPEDLACRELPVSVVGTQPDDGPRAGRTRRVLASHGASCELRLLLRNHRGVWGFLGLVRSEGGRAFDQNDMKQVAQLGPALATAMRAYARAVPLSPCVPAQPPGVITVGADHTITGVTPQAQAWLEQVWMPGCGTPDGILALFAAELSLHLRAHVRDPLAVKPLICASATNLGRWVAVHGQPLDPAVTGEVAIVIQAADGELLLSSFCQWYEITTRERCVIERLRAGAAPKRIARDLHVSVHTVNDHLKSVYRKTGADGRDELVAALTA